MRYYRSQSLSQKERTYQFLYLVSMLLLTQLLLGLIFLSSYQSPFSQTTVLDAQLVEQYNQFNDLQKTVEPVMKETFQKISQLQATSPQPQVEDDLARRIDAVASFFSHTNSYDPRKEGYRQIANFYQMYFEDKKIVGRKTENTEQFRKEFEECSIGFKDKKQQLIQRKNMQLAK